MSQEAYTGHNALFGMDAGTNPTSIPKSLASLAVNRRFRNRRNRTRPPFLSSSISFNDDKLKETFETRAIRGVFEYNAVSPNATSCMLAFVGDSVVALYPSETSISAVKLFDGLSQLTDTAAFVQVADRAYFQDGDGLKMGWDGVGDPYKLGDGLDDMPIFVAMYECQGRIVGITESGFAIISDHVYSNGVGKTDGAESWTEYQYFNDIGAIPFPSNLGSFVGATAIRQDAIFNTQGPIFIGGTKGAYTLDLSGPRDTWNYGSIVKEYTVIGGCGSPGTIVNAGTDVWWQDPFGGIRSFKYQRSDAEREWSEQSFSDEVNDFTSLSTVHSIRHASSVVFDDRMLITVGIRTEPDVIGAQHRYSVGMVVMDFNRGTITTPDHGYSWDGLWTGIQVTKFCKIGTACYAFVYDNGKNEIFQITADSGDDVGCDGSSVKIKSMYQTSLLFFDESQNVARTLKQLQSISINAISESGGTAECRVKGYSGASYNLGIALTQGRKQDHLINLASIQPHVSGPIHFGAPSDLSGDVGFFVSIHMEGDFVVDSLTAKATLAIEDIATTSQLTESCHSQVDPFEPFSYKICK